MAIPLVALRGQTPNQADAVNRGVLQGQGIQQNAFANELLGKQVNDCERQVSAEETRLGLDEQTVANRGRALDQKDAETLRQLIQEKATVGANVADTFLGLSPERQAALYPQFAEKARELFPNIQLPDQFSPDLLPVIKLRSSELRGIAGDKVEQDNILAKIFDPESPTGVTNVRREDAIGQPAPAQKGLTVATNPDGTVTVTTGGTQAGTTKGTRTKLEQSVINSQEGLARIKAIRSGFNENFLTFFGAEDGGFGKFDAAFAAFKEKAFGKISPEEQQKLAEFSTFARDTIENLNLYIKEITGAQMSEAEAKRLGKAVPNLDDSPTQFKSKMDSLIKSLVLARARAVFALNNGVENPMSVPLDSIEGIISAREAELLGQGLDEATVEAQLRQEFGL